jgi:hypothetical protein
LPSVKELHYFDQPGLVRSWNKKKRRPALLKSARYGFGPWYWNFLLGRRSDEWYAGLFHKSQLRGLIAGEVTPDYVALDEAVFRHIRSMNVAIKLVLVMRDPVDRAWSAVNHLLRQGRVTRPLTLEKAVARALSRAVTARSAYALAIKKLETVFEPHQLHFCFFDDLRDRPEMFAAELLTFLGVNPSELKQLPLGAVNEVVGASPAPLGFKRAMAEAYMPMICELCQRFKGAPQVWQIRYERLTGRGGEGSRPN